MRSGRFRFHYAILVLFASRVFCASPAWPKGNGSLHNWRFMSQAISRESRDERESPFSSRFAHKAPGMQAKETVTTVTQASS